MSREEKIHNQAWRKHCGLQLSEEQKEMLSPQALGTSSVESPFAYSIIVFDHHKIQYIVYGLMMGGVGEFVVSFYSPV